MVAQRAAAAALITGLLAIARFANCNTEGNILYEQRMAWQDPINVLKSWDPTSDNSCSWEHVSCDSKNYVIRLDLGKAGIIGPLIPLLVGLKKLQYLNVENNNLTGTVTSAGLRGAHEHVIFRFGRLIIWTGLALAALF